MGYMYRYSPAVVLLRQMLARGWLGDPFEVHAVMSKVVAPAERRGLAEYPGGTMFELGCHLIDLVVGVLGKPQAVTPFVQHTAKADDGLADNMLAVFRYPSALASVKSSALEVEGGERRHLVVCGTEGTFHIQPLDNPAGRVAFRGRTMVTNRACRTSPSPSSCATSPTPPTWHESSAAKNRATSPTHTTSTFRKRCSARTSRHT